MSFCQTYFSYTENQNTIISEDRDTETQGEIEREKTERERERKDREKEIHKDWQSLAGENKIRKELWRENDRKNEGQREGLTERGG